MAKLGTLDHLITWIAGKPANEAFVASATPQCLFCQYGEVFHLGTTYDEIVARVELSDAEREIIVGGERTFGLALERARSL